MTAAWQRDAAEVAAELGTDAHADLSAAEAAARLARYGPNQLEGVERVPAWRRFLAQFADPLIYLLMVATVISIAAWVSDGAEGVAEVASLMVAEAALTGESEPALKDTAALAGTAALGDRINMVFNGTAVTRGRGAAVVTATGMATEMGKGGAPAQPYRDGANAAPARDRATRPHARHAVLAIAVVVVAAILLTARIERAPDVVDVLLIGVSLAVAAVPEGLPALLAVVLALGVQRMARRHAIVKRLASVETLGSTSVVWATSPCTRAWRPSTSSASSTRYEPTARSSP